MNILSVEDLTHVYPGTNCGIFDIRLCVGQGSFVVVAGRNGSGKTTLLKHLNGLLCPHRGRVVVDGVPVEQDLKRARQRVGFVFQDADSQIVGETVYEDVAFGPRNLNLSADTVHARTLFAMAAVALTELADRAPHTLSGGEKRRLAVAGVLAMQPGILVFDEPFSNLDDPGVRQVLEQIVSLHRSGQTVMVTTHDLEKVIAHADRLVVMSHGRICLDGPPLTVLPRVAEFGIRPPCAYTHRGVLESWLA
ncbi:MAG: ABC transporter ATP-binding protein [Pseudomonadota bacterium]